MGIGTPRRGTGLRRNGFHHCPRRPDCRYLSLFRQTRRKQLKYVEASRFGGPEVLKIVERETSRPPEGTLLVEVQPAGINYADMRPVASGFTPLWRTVQS